MKGIFSFDVEFSDPDSQARVGVMNTPAGAIPTPAFIPGGTKATVKAIPESRWFG